MRRPWSRARGGRAWVATFFGALLTATACSDASDVVLLEIDAAGVIAGAVFLDEDASGAFSLGDSPIEGVDVVLVTAATAQVAGTAMTDSLGVFALLDVPVGSYRISIEPSALGDSLEVLEDTPVTISVGDTTLVSVGASYPVLTIEEALAAPVGNRVFTSGIALNQRLNFDPTGQVHVAGDSRYLRALNVERAGISPGDSVRFLGRVVIDNGRVALDRVTPFLLVPQAELATPVELAVEEAASAGGGALDAALARIRTAEITDTSTALDGHFRFWAVAGADSIEVVLRDFLGFNTAVIRPDTILRIDRAVGLLTPLEEGGSVRWRLLPRTPTDVVLETKIAEIGVTAALDTTAASLGDTVRVTVVASNAGPVAATGLQVQDTVPTALAFVSSTATNGAYDEVTGLWTIGDLGVGVSDTLVIEMEVIDGTAATVPNIVLSLGPLREVDPDIGNNGAIVVLTIS